jgi:hypothetical protein
MSLFAIQELLGHAWTGTTARSIHVHAAHVEDAWVVGRAATRHPAMERTGLTHQNPRSHSIERQGNS